MSQRLRAMIGKFELQEILKYQEDMLRKEGYSFKAAANLDTHCYAQVTKGHFYFSVAITHNGSREDIQCASDECALDIFEAAWKHFHSPERKVYRDLKGLYPREGN